MIKKFLFLFLLFKGVLFAQNFTGKYNFSAVSGSCVSTCSVDPTPPPAVTGLDFGSFLASGTSTAPNASGRFSFQKWPGGATNGVDTYTAFTGSLSLSSYYEVSLAPQAGYTLTLSGISFSVRRSSTGIRNYAVRSSLDGYSRNLPASVGTNPKLSVVDTSVFFWSFDATSNAADQVGSLITPDSSFSALTDTVTFRFYAWNAENVSQGTFSIDSVVFTGRVYDTLPGPPVVTNLHKIAGTKQDILLFPNPSPDGKVTLESPVAVLNVEVVDCLGDLVFQYKPLVPTPVLNLDLGMVDEGAYFIHLTFSDGKSGYTRLLICK